jgi:hypothetical protein
LKAKGLEGGVWGPAAGARPLISAGAAAAAHGARVLTLWPTTLGFPDAVGRGVRTWPHRPVLPTVGVSPNIVPHGGRNSYCRGVRRHVHFSKIQIRLFIFRKSWQVKYKKIMYFASSVLGIFLFFLWFSKNKCFQTNLPNLYLLPYHMVAGFKCRTIR